MLLTNSNMTPTSRRLIYYHINANLPVIVILTPCDKVLAMSPMGTGGLGVPDHATEGGRPGRRGETPSQLVSSGERQRCVPSRRNLGVKYLSKKHKFKGLRDARLPEVLANKLLRTLCRGWLTDTCVQNREENKRCNSSTQYNSDKADESKLGRPKSVGSLDP